MVNVAIYVRVSALDQHPENQLAPCRLFCERKGFDIEGEYIERLSAFKDVERPVYDLVKGKAHSGEIQGVVVWAFDRWVRRRDTLLEDVTILSNYGCKLHAIKDSWIEAINIDGPLGRTLREFLLGLVGSLAEMESSRKSERVKLAYANRKGKKWGRRALPKRVAVDVLRLYANGKSMRWIKDNVTYYDKNKNKKTLSLGSVHKIVSEKVV